ncbi:MAG: hypothetical protein FWG65_06985 [Turicibacter sp.]|nr:hypothetical protein [Turicibacter sp.]
MLTYFVIVPLVVAIFLYLFPFERLAKIIAVLFKFALFGASLYLLYQINLYGTIVETVGLYEDSLGVVLRADTLSGVFIMLTTFMFLVVDIYNFKDNPGRLFGLLFFVWQSMILGLFLTSDFFNVFVLMEVATLTVTVMILFNQKKRSMYDGLVYLMIGFAGIQFYLFGIGYLYRSLGVLEMQSIAVAARELDPSQLILPYALIMSFIALKCALLPLFSWLPKAHSTPGASPGVSAVLSGLHIKTGVYLFVRFQDVFYEVSSSTLFLVIGLATAVVGIILALSERNIKRILAYSTMAQVGLIIAGFSIGGEYNSIGSIYHMVNHAIFKAALFLGVGVIAYSYGTKDIYKIQGVLKKMPFVGIVIIFAILGIIGMPAFNGSISKYFLMYDIDPILNAIMVVINLGTIMVFIKFSTIFKGVPAGEVTPERDLFKYSALAVLGALCLIFGVFGQSILRSLLDVHITIDLMGYLEKSAIFAASLGVGYLLHSRIIRDRVGNLGLQNRLDLGFRGMCAGIGVFFVLVLVAANFS